MPLKKLTALNVKRLEAVDGQRTEWRDTEQPGLALRVTPEGARSYAVEYSWQGESRRETIGPLENWELAKARAEAKRIRAKVDLGIDPRAERLIREGEERAKVKGAKTVQTLAADFLASREAKRWREKTTEEFTRLVNVEIVPALGDLPVGAVTRGAVRSMLDKIVDRAPYIANRTLSVLKLMWAWALDRELVETSPVVGLKRPAEEKPRDINWSDDDLRAIFAARAAAGPAVADVVALLFHTGARLDEVQGMAWGEVDLDRKEWRLPPERSKIGRKKPRARVVPLTDSAIEILKRRKAVKVVNLARARFVFPAPRGEGHMTRRSKPIKALKDASGVADFKPHAIRHAVRSRLAQLKVASSVAEMILGHALRGMEGTYTGSGVEFLPEQRAALELWEIELLRILADKSGVKAVRA